MWDRQQCKRFFWPALTGATLIAAIGVGLICFPIGFGLARLSYDLPFCLRSGMPGGLVFIQLSQNAKANLGAPLDQPLALSYHTALIKRLKKDGARLVFYDFIFDEPSQTTEADAQLAEAIKAQGNVVLVGYLEKELTGNVLAEVVTPPIPVLSKAAAGWGLAKLVTDPDDAMRSIDTGVESCPSATWVAAKLLKAATVQDENERPLVRWLNYYDAPDAFPTVNFDQALDEQGLPPGYFHDKIVVVGAAPSVGLINAGREEFGTPHSRFGRRLASGPQIHALTLMNLLRGDWLKEMNLGWQVGLVSALGLFLGAGMMSARPAHGAWLTVAVSALIGMLSIYFQLYQNLWWPWLVPAAVQTPLALVWSVGWQYHLESRRRKKLRAAFAGYLSPHLADRIADEQFDLSLGGKIVEATIMFTDLNGFTALSEKLPPDEVSRILTTYFNETTRGILEQEGTIIKYMGDAVMAVWGAPLPDSQQAERAVLGAWEMIQRGRTEMAGRLLSTRIGINSGPALAGNLGSTFRFDYSVIGDTTNTAQRLECLNKQFGTNILISESTRCQLSPRFRTRNLGRVRVLGRTQSVMIHEVLCVDCQSPDQFPWLPTFEEALRDFTEFKLDRAAELFARVKELRGEADGPSEFYLEQITIARANPPTSASWDGVIVLSSK